MYNNTEKFWDDIFEKEKLKDLSAPFGIEKLDSCIDWLCANTGSIIDYGCGNASMLLRCAYLNVKKGLGIDISCQAVRTAVDYISKKDLSGFSVIQGSLEALKSIKDASFEGAILSNIIDNILPDDALCVLKNIYRILTHGGRVFVKLNDFMDKEKLKESIDFFEKEISDNFFLEKSGLYFHNLSDEKFERWIMEYFKVVEKGRIEFKTFDCFNRFYLLQKL
ncbi:MAG: class I SAM-dependent methyltransferase [Petrotogaceae bacterium]|jgi:ubiquinone/menaquinone biosynthesis C-methylase UbiE|nr:class I SAM-dependent methyltransferase [Petrotogaceae bacterium]